MRKMARARQHRRAVVGGVGRDAFPYGFGVETENGGTNICTGGAIRFARPPATALTLSTSWQVAAR